MFTETKIKSSEQTRIKCVRKVQFCAGHRVMGHENKCATPHGHNYVLHLLAETPSLDPLGRVIDFSVLKEKIGGWVDTHWDHTFLVFEQDREMIEALKIAPGKKDPYLCPFNPTAENLAEFILRKIAPELLEGSGVQLTRVILYETDNCYAIAEI